MKTTVFKPTTMPVAQTGGKKPTINFNHKSGLICLSQTTMRSLGNPERVSFKLVEEKGVREWYIFSDADGFALRRDGKSSNRAMINNVTLCRMMVDSTCGLRVSEAVNNEHGGLFIFPQEEAGSKG